jgi:hypothetical protein
MTQGGWFGDKTEGQQYRDTVPLNLQRHLFFSNKKTPLRQLTCTFLLLRRYFQNDLII